MPIPSASRACNAGSPNPVAAAHGAAHLWPAMLDIAFDNSYARLPEGFWTPQPPTPVAAPRLLKTRAELAAAPIDHRDAFVLSLLDGKTSVQGVVDLAAMPDGEVLGILERLAKLGIVHLP